MAYESEDTTALVQLGPAKLSFPLLQYQDAATKMVEQDYVIQAHKYVAPTIGAAYSANGLFSSPAPTIGDAYLVGDTYPQLIETGLVKFTRTWVNVPATRYDFTSYAAVFPGITDQRQSFTKTVTAQITYDYFRVGAGLTYETPQEIPVVEATGFFGDGWSGPRTADGFFINDNIINPSTPTLTAWLAAADTYYYKPEDSKLERWMGNIWVRSSLAVYPI